ncbi:hypothetical protein ScPMuIL_013121 [Solemya velum]
MSANNNFLIDFKDELKKEEFRFGTFKNWPSTCPLQPSEFARMGFCYSSTSGDDEVQCVFCAVKLKGWKSGDSILKSHLKKSPKCKFLMGKDVGNVTWPKPSSSIQKPAVVPADPTNESASTGNLSFSKYPGYASEKSRIASLKNWSKAKSQNIQAMAAAGLFYTGEADKMKCFHCAGGFQNWFPSDDPLQIHKQIFPQCAYIQQHAIDMAQKAVLEARNKERAKELADQENPEILIKQVNEQAEELDNLKQEVTCDICMEGKVDSILLPCGHVFCSSCCGKLQRCAKCRTLVLEIKQFYK